MRGRAPEYYDGTYAYLKGLGIKEVKGGDRLRLRGE